MAASIDDSFMSFHMLCDQIQSDTSLTVKKDVIRAFVSRYSGDLGLLFKLLLPKHNGRLYQLQDKQLIKLLSIALGQSETTLKNHLNGSGCIGLTAAHFFKPRVPPLGNCQLNAKGICQLRLADIDSHLDALSQASGEAMQLNALQKFLAVACRNALFTFLRSVKQDLHLGAGVRVVLEGLHPSASAIYKRCANIQEVVRRVQAGSTDDPDDADTLSNQSGQSRAVSPGVGVRKGHVEASITMFMPLAPMLASPSNGVDHVLLKTPNGAFSETKYDGERIQIHKKGKEFRFFARSLKPMKADKYDGLEKYLVEAVKADTCILDGEILLVDIATSKPLPFGTLGKHKRAQFATACTCIFLFDIMYKDGQTLLDVPMDARREYLKSSVQFIQNRVMISEMRVVSGPPSERRLTMQKHLQYAVAEGLEGLVIKDMKSVYGPGTRHWIKLKKDYLQGMADSADLIVLGAWYGSGNKGGVLSTFLMGVWDKKAIGPKRFKTVVKVGNGHDDATLAKLNAYFNSSGRVIVGGPGVLPPPWIDISTSHYPDVYINPIPTADVWEISAAEFSRTKTHTAGGVSMRFPRVTKIRDDKDLASATSLEELVALMEASTVKGSKLDALGAHQRVDSDSDDANEGATERGVMMRTSSRYDGPTAVVSGQHFGPLSASAVTALQCNPAAVSAAASSALIDSARASTFAAMPQGHKDQLLQYMQAGQGHNNNNSNTTQPRDEGPILKQTPFWVFRTRGFKGDTPPPMPGADAPDAPDVGSIEYVQGDVAQPRGLAAHPHQHVLLIHCCALGPGMKWSQRGTMGSLSKFVGDEPEEAYASYTSCGEAAIGDAILVECSNVQNKGRLFVATILGQKGGQGVPQVDQDAFEHALLAHLLPFAKAHMCAVHIPKLDRSIGADWGLIDKVLRYTYSRQHNLRVVVYQKGAVAVDSLNRQGTALPQGLGSRSATAAFVPPSAPLQRAETALPPVGYPESTITARSPQITGTSSLLAGVKACLFSPEGLRATSEPESAASLRAELVNLGATVLPHTMFGASDRPSVLAAATHIILPIGYTCRAAASSGAAEALIEILTDLRLHGSDAAVVRGDWVSECQQQRTLLPTADFGLTRVISSPRTEVHSQPPLASPSRGLARGPLAGRYVLIVGGSSEERDALTMAAQDLGAVVQDRLRLSDAVGVPSSMRLVRTGEVVSVPSGRTTHVLVKAAAVTQSSPTDSFREGSARAGSVSSVPLRVYSTVAHMGSAADAATVGKALSLGANVLLSTWLSDLARSQQGAAASPREADYFVDSAVLFEASSHAAASTRATPLGTKRARADSVSDVPFTSLGAGSPAIRPTSSVVAPTPAPLTPSHRAPFLGSISDAYQRLPPFLLPSSALVLSLHGYGADETGELVQRIASLQSLAVPRTLTLEANLNLFAVRSAAPDVQQRILICDTLTATSLPLLRGVAATCKRALAEPSGATVEFRSATVVGAAWVAACLEASAVLPVEQFVYRPPAAFGECPSTKGSSFVHMSSAVPSNKAPPRPPLDDDSTDTASFCTVQDVQDGAAASGNELTDVEE